MAQVFVGTYEQGSREILDYVIDWTETVTSESDTASGSVWYADQGNPTIGDGANGADAPTLSTNQAKVWIVNGNVGEEYHVTNVLTGTSGREYEASIRVTIIDK